MINVCQSLAMLCVGKLWCFAHVVMALVESRRYLVFAWQYDEEVLAEAKVWRCGGAISARLVMM